MRLRSRLRSDVECPVTESVCEENDVVTRSCCDASGLFSRTSFGLTVTPAFVEMERAHVRSQLPVRVMFLVLHHRSDIVLISSFTSDDVMVPLKSDTCELRKVNQMGADSPHSQMLSSQMDRST